MKSEKEVRERRAELNKFMINHKRLEKSMAYYNGTFDILNWVLEE